MASFPDDSIAAAYCFAANAAGFATEAHLALAPDRLETASLLVAAVAGVQATGDHDVMRDEEVSEGADENGEPSNG